MLDNNSRALAGRCGLYCGACCIYRAERDCDELVRKLAENWNCPPEKVRCDGCGALSGDSWGIECELVKCQNEKGYSYCYECAEFEADTCERYKKLADAYLEEDGVNMRRNMALVKEGKLDEWLEESRKHYTCPHCNGPTITGSEKCHHCEGSLA